MSTNFNTTPRPIHRNIKDVSGGTPPVVVEQFPSHFPHIFMFTQRGKEGPQIVNPSMLNRLYGTETFNLRGKYATHQTLLAEMFANNANQMVVHRLKSPDAGAPSNLTLSLEVVKDDIQVYERDSEGRIKRDVNGDPVEEAGVTQTGHRVRWVVGHADGTVGNIFGERTSQAGALVGEGPTQSTIYPIVDFEVSSFGEHGQLKGIRLSAPTERSQSGANTRVMNVTRSFLYNFQFVERPSPQQQPVIIETLSGATGVDVSFKPDTLDEVFNIEYDIEDRLIQSYHDEDDVAAGEPPFTNMHFYSNNVETILGELFAEELALQPSWSAGDEYLINLVSGLDASGAELHTVQVLGAADGGVTFTSNTTHYAKGGSDGTIDNDTFNELVKEQLENYGDLEHKFLDRARWPQNFIWDTGFAMDTKMAFFEAMGRHPSMIAVVSTQDASMPVNTVEEETSALLALQARARMYPESEVYGTTTCRAAVVGCQGYLLDKRWPHLTVATVALADKVSATFGAGNGEMNRDRAFDVTPNNKVNMFRQLFNTYKNDKVRDNDWDNGLVWIESYNPREYFFPQVQTVYDDKSSTINSLMNVIFTSVMKRIADGVWRDLTGRSDLTDEEFLQLSDEYIEERAQEQTIFGGRVLIGARTFYTSMDKELGNTWSTDIHMGMNNMRTAGSFTIVAERRANFTGNQ